MKTVEQIKIEALWEICFKNIDKELSYLRKIDELEEKIKELNINWNKFPEVFPKCCDRVLIELQNMEHRDYIFITSGIYCRDRGGFIPDAGRESGVGFRPISWMPLPKGTYERGSDNAGQV